MSGMKPCPFCGEIPNPDWTDESYIECTNRKCSLYSYGMSTGDWQTRPIEDDLRKRIAELEVALKSKVIIINNQEKRINELAERILKNV